VVGRVTNPLQIGIGRGLLSKYLARENHTVIAAVRDPSNSTSKSLSSLPVGKGSALITVPLDASSETSITNAIHTLKTQYSITSLSVVVANAGMVEFYGTVLQTPVQGARDHYNTNVIGALALFQEVYPLLQSSPEGVLPKFVTITSTVGSIGAMEDWSMKATAYGSSKASLNWLTKNIHIENPGLIAFPIHPGYVSSIYLLFYCVDFIMMNAGD
jgi:norsolorinic acid ketoreductase